MVSYQVDFGNSREYIETVVLPFQFTQASVILDRLNFIKMSFIYIGNPNKLQIMRPTQKKLASGAHGRKVFELAKHCFANLVIRIDLVKPCKKKAEKILKKLALTSCRVADGFVLWRQNP